MALECVRRSGDAAPGGDATCMAEYITMLPGSLQVIAPWLCRRNEPSPFGLLSTPNALPKRVAAVVAQQLHPVAGLRGGDRPHCGRVREGARAQRQCAKALSASRRPTRRACEVANLAHSQAAVCWVTGCVVVAAAACGRTPRVRARCVCGKAIAARHALLVGASAPLGTAKRGTFI